MNLEEIAKKIAEKANECCYRSDGYEERIKNLVIDLIKDEFSHQCEDPYTCCYHKTESK